MPAVKQTIAVKKIAEVARQRNSVHSSTTGGSPMQFKMRRFADVQTKVNTNRMKPPKRSGLVMAEIFDATPNEESGKYATVEPQIDIPLAVVEPPTEQANANEEKKEE